MKKNILISAVADNFVPHLLTMLESLGSAINDIDIGVIEFSVGEKVQTGKRKNYLAGEGGLSEANKKKILKLKPDCKFAMPKWFIDLPEKHRNISSKIYSNKPFIPELFSGYDGYLYVDADVYFFDSSAVTDWIEAGQAYGASLYYEQFPLTQPYLRSRNKRFYRKNLTKKLAYDLVKRFEIYFGEGEGIKYGKHPVLNGGMFFIKGNNALWKLWQDTMAGINFNKALKSYIFCDQTCLQYALLKNKIDFTLMSPCHHWYILHDDVDSEFPMFCLNRNLLVNNVYPHDPIKAIHLGIEYENTKFTLKSTDGRIFKTKLTRKELLKNHDR